MLFILYLFLLSLIADAFNENSACSVLPSARCSWGLVTMSKTQCEKGFRHIACGISLKRGEDQDWVYDHSARLSNVRKTRPDQQICWKRTAQQLQVFCPNNWECENLSIEKILSICDAETPETPLPNGSPSGCSSLTTRVTCNGQTASITKEECERGLHYLYCGFTAVKDQDSWRYTGQSKHFLYGGLPEPCRVINETAFVAICKENECNNEAWRASTLNVCGAKAEPKVTKHPLLDNGPFKQDWFHSEEDLLQNMVEIEEKSSEIRRPVDAGDMKGKKEGEIDEDEKSRLMRYGRKTDPVVELLNRDLARNDLTMQGIAQNLAQLNLLVQNISETVNNLKTTKENSRLTPKRPFSRGPNFKAFKNCSIILASILLGSILVCAFRSCKKRVYRMRSRNTRTPSDQEVPTVENGERSFNSMQIIVDSSRLSLLVPPPSHPLEIGSRRSTIARAGSDAGRKSFFLDDNNMQSIIAEARDMQLREDTESQM